MAYKVQLIDTGSPEVMHLTPLELTGPKPGEVQIQHEAIGVNFIDCYHRSGLYQLEDYPFSPGLEGAGVITAIGEDVEGVSIGDRVVYLTPTPGSYVTHRNVLADYVLPIPPSVDFDMVMACWLKGLTVHMLFEKVYPVREGTNMLFHAASGGVGLIACQWAQQKGANIYGTVSHSKKAVLARDYGCTHVIDYVQSDFEDVIMEKTGGKGLDVVFDGVGKKTFEKSLNCLKPFGLMVSFGNSSGAVPPFAIGELAAKGSLYLTRPSLFTYIKDLSNYRKAGVAVLEKLRCGDLKIAKPNIFPLQEVVEAHRALEERRTMGSLILRP